MGGEVDLDDFADSVDVDQVHSLLLGRSPRLLDPNSDKHSLYLQIRRGVAAEVAPLAGEPDTPRRELATWCVALGLASQLEAALFPEQQDETGRAEYLEGRYAKVLGQLGGRITGDGADGDGATSGGQAAGDGFPIPRGYPDPARPDVHLGYFGPGIIL